MKTAYLWVSDRILRLNMDFKKVWEEFNKKKNQGKFKALKSDTMEVKDILDRYFKGKTIKRRT